MPHDWALNPFGRGRRRQVPAAVRELGDAQRQFNEHRRLQQLRAGHGRRRDMSAIQPFSAGFRVLGSTETAVDARDNTCTTGAGVGIHWLNGSQDRRQQRRLLRRQLETTRAAGRNESGNSTRASTRVWTGSAMTDGSQGGFIPQGFSGSSQVTNWPVSFGLRRARLLSAEPARFFTRECPVPA